MIRHSPGQLHPTLPKSVVTATSSTNQPSQRRIRQANPLKENSKSYTDVADGIWYLHLIAKDNAGNWGSADHYRVKIGSGEASTTDTVIALAIAVGSREYDSRWDVSGDGQITSLDALMILQAAGGNIDM